MRKLIFVCTGNTCRSPMAEGLMRKKLATGAAEVSSRGIAVWGDAGAHPLAVQAVGRYKVDISGHRARPFDADEVDEDTMVLAMTQEHARIIVRQHPRLEGKVETIAAYAGATGDIEDPYGFDIHAYESCASELDRLTGRIAEQYK